MIRIGLIGKTNAGKTTFFNAATLLSAPVSTYPFTTKKPNLGQAYGRTICVCKELDVKDTPRNSSCINGARFIPVQLIDLPGLVKGSWMGRGLRHTISECCIASRRSGPHHRRVRECGCRRENHEAWDGKPCLRCL